MPVPLCKCDKPDVRMGGVLYRRGEVVARSVAVGVRVRGVRGVHGAKQQRRHVAVRTPCGGATAWAGSAGVCERAVRQKA